MHKAQIDLAMALATPYGQSVTFSGTAAFVVQYVPSLGTGGAAATIALIQDGAMTFLVDGSVPAGTDAIGTAGVITTSGGDYDTIGELVDYINSTQAWRAYIVGALRTDGCETLLAKSATTCFVDNGLSFYWDNDAGFTESAVFSGEKFVNMGKNGHVTETNCLNFLLGVSLNLDMASAGTLKVYSATQRSDGTVLWSAALADATLTEKGYTEPNGVWLQSTIGQRLIVRAAHATDIGTAVAKFDTIGKTAVLDGTRIVTGINY